MCLYNFGTTVFLGCLIMVYNKRWTLVTGAMCKGEGVCLAVDQPMLDPQHPILFLNPSRSDPLVRLHE